MRRERHGDWVICRKMHKIMFKNSAGNNATLCSLVSTARRACCSLQYHHAAKMCLSERLHFNNFIPYFSPQNKNVPFLNIILADSWSQRWQMVSLLIIHVKIFIFLFRCCYCCYFKLILQGFTQQNTVKFPTNNLLTKEYLSTLNQGKSYNLKKLCLFKKVKVQFVNNWVVLNRKKQPRLYGSKTQ